MTTFQLNLSDQLAKDLQKKASELNTDVNKVIVNAVERVLFLSRFEELRKDFNNRNTIGWQTEEDLFKDIS